MIFLGISSLCCKEKKVGHIHAGASGGRGGGGRTAMNPAQRAPTPVSRELIKLIREASKLDAPQANLSEHMRAVDAKQAQAVEFYIRACALRLEQTM